MNGSINEVNQDEFVQLTNAHKVSFGLFVLWTDLW